MLITDLPYRQKYLTTCMEITKSIITFSGMEEHFRVVPRLQGCWWGEDWYFPEMTVYVDNCHFCGLMFNFRQITSFNGLLTAIIPGLRSLGRSIKAYDENAPLPSSEELYDILNEIYKRIWEPKK